ncbi:hypothetical protein [Dietzia sp. Alg238-R159]|uniref:hypothetical protein n=1 Tax=Dietzia sp. Alg238-R159 TaxID=2305986 RepID=UPI0013D474DD|nr:hypothetical protein [Dietzia sp. Alg238-R159]
MTIPPLTPQNQAAYRKTKNPHLRLAILATDFRKSKEVKELDELHRATMQKERIAAWFPALLTVPNFGRYRKAPTRAVHVDRSRIEFYPIFLHPAAWILFRKLFNIAFLIAIVALVDALLNRVVWYVFNGMDERYALTAMFVLEGRMGPYRIHSGEWSIIAGPFAALTHNEFLTTFSHFAYSPITLLSAAIIGILWSDRTFVIVAFWALVMIPTAWLAELGVIPSFRAWLLLSALTACIGTTVTMIRCRRFLRLHNAAREVFNSKYWPYIRKLSREARKDDRANARPYRSRNHICVGHPDYFDIVNGRLTYDELFERHLRSLGKPGAFLENDANPHRSNNHGSVGHPDYLDYLGERHAYDELFDRRTDSISDARAFRKAEKELNESGFSSVSGRFIGTQSPLSPTLAELIENHRFSRTTPAQLASAAGITLDEATQVLEANSIRTLDPGLHKLYEAFRRS